MSHTYHDLLLPGREGDKTAIIKMTARQIAIIELFLEAAIEYGVGTLALEAIAVALDIDTAERARLEFNIAQKRIGIAMCRVLGDADYAAQLTAELAQLDGEATSL